MKISIYKAPDGFFEEFETTVANRTNVIRSRRRKVAGAAAAAIALTAVFTIMPFGLKNDENEMLSACVEEEILNTYEYDIFLNNYQL